MSGTPGRDCQMFTGVAWPAPFEDNAPHASLHPLGPQIENAATGDGWTVEALAAVVDMA